MFSPAGQAGRNWPNAVWRTLRSGKGRTARRVLLTEQAIRTLRAYLKVRYPADPADQERG